MLRLSLDSGIRSGELIGLTLDDVDLSGQVAVVMGKGGHGRTVPYRIRTTEAEVSEGRTPAPARRRDVGALVGSAGTSDRLGDAPSRTPGR